MEDGPVVLLGQGEQYADPADWRELIRTRRIRRGVELPVRRHGLTTLRRPEDVPELVAVLDAVDPPGPPSQTVASLERPPAASAPATAVPPSAARPATRAGVSAPAAPATAAPGAPALPTAAPRKRWRFGVWRWVFALAALLLVRLCAHDGFGGLPSFGDRAGAPPAASSPSSQADAAACARPRGWIAKAACDDPEFARLRPVVARAYAARLAGLSGETRQALSDEQGRWQASRSACRSASDPGGCLSERYRARLAELQPRAEAPPPPDASAPAPPPLAPVAVVERPEWVRRPGADDLADAYPERALRLDIDGRALLSCRAMASGGLTACDIVSEDPPDYGFGAAALRLSRFYGIAPRTADGRPVAGAKVDLPVAFKGG